MEIRAALDHLNGTGSSEAALAFAVDCLPLWWDLGHIEEGYRHLTERLNASDGNILPPLLRAAASAGAAILAEAAGGSDAAVALARSAGQLAAEAGARAQALPWWSRAMYRCGATRKRMRWSDCMRRSIWPARHRTVLLLGAGPADRW